MHYTAIVLHFTAIAVWLPLIAYRAHIAFWAHIAYRAHIACWAYIAYRACSAYRAY